MDPTPANRLLLRRMVDELIPPNGSDADTRLIDAECDAILALARSLNDAAAEAWTRKAARAMSERGGLEESHVGDERHKFVGIEGYRDHCLAMAAMFARRASRGSRVMGMAVQDVLGADTGRETDIGRILEVADR